MNCASRLSRILLASAFALAAFAAAPALAEPAAPAPVAVPYPNTSPRDPASGLPTGKRMHKPYTLSAAPPAPTPAQCTTSPNVEPVNAASDPEEGGQVAPTTARKVKVSDMTITKKIDKASPTLADGSAPGNTCPSDPR